MENIFSTLFSRFKWFVFTLIPAAQKMNEYLTHTHVVGIIKISLSYQ